MVRSRWACAMLFSETHNSNQPIRSRGLKILHKTSQVLAQLCPLCLLLLLLFISFSRYLFMISRWELVLVRFHVLTVCFSTFPISLMVVKCHSGGMGSIVWILSTLLHQITFSLYESHISLCQILKMMACINIDVYGSGCCRCCCSHKILAWCRWLYATVTCLTTSEKQCAASLHNTNTQRDAVFTTTRPQTPQINSTPICMLILAGRKLWFHSWISDLLPIWSVKSLL